MTNANPYQPPLSTTTAPVVERLQPHNTARVASGVLIVLGGCFLLLTFVNLLFGLARSFIAAGNPSLFSGKAAYDLFVIFLLSIQIWAGVRSWHYRIPIVGAVATFVICVLLTDTKVAPLFSPACLASIGVLFFTGWVRRASAPQGGGQHKKD